MKKGKRCLAALLLAVVCGGWTAVQAYQVPQPLDNFYVADYAGVISDEDAETIRSINASLEQRNGAQIVVATVDFLDGEAIDDVAYQMFNEWEIGSEENLGVLLLMAIGEEDYYCMPGVGLESALPASTLQQILDEQLEPDFAAGNYSAGALKTVRQLASTVEKVTGTPVSVPQDPVSQPVTSTGSFFGSFFAFVPSLLVLVVVLVIVMAVVSLARPRRYYGGGFRPRPIWFRPRPRAPRPPRDPFGPRPVHPAPRQPSPRRSSGSFASRSSGAGRRSFGGMNRGGGGRTRGGGAGRRRG